MKIEKVPKEMKSEKNFFEVKDGNSECVLSINEDAFIVLSILSMLTFKPTVFAKLTI